MNRYSHVHGYFDREIVLLIGRPCFWGKCTFCDYIDDNSLDKDFIVSQNSKILKNITGQYKVLEVINSGSVFEIPKETLSQIREIVREKNIEKLIFEAHYAYRNRLDEIRDFFGEIEVYFKTGVETFDNYFREEVLLKNAKFETFQEVEKYFDSVCLLVGIKGQTREMIERDLEICRDHFKWITVNIFIENTTPVKRDEELVEWFTKKYRYLEKDRRYEILFENTDFGVGEILV